MKHIKKFKIFEEAEVKSKIDKKEFCEGFYINLECSMCQNEAIFAAETEEELSEILDNEGWVNLDSDEFGLTGYYCGCDYMDNVIKEEREYRATNEPDIPEELVDDKLTIGAYITKYKGTKTAHEIYLELKKMGFDSVEISKYLDEREF
jgi:hypothetical protein